MLAWKVKAKASVIVIDLPDHSIVCVCYFEANNRLTCSSWFTEEGVPPPIFLGRFFCNKLPPSSCTSPTPAAFVSLPTPSKCCHYPPHPKFCHYPPHPNVVITHPIQMSRHEISLSCIDFLISLFHPPLMAGLTNSTNQRSNQMHQKQKPPGLKAQD